jgi:hypothetical protein
MDRRASTSFEDFPAYSRILPLRLLLGQAAFNYLRTVIVTAAIHRGFGSELLLSCDRITLPLNLPALGRCQSPYIDLSS